MSTAIIATPTAPGTAQVSMSGERREIRWQLSHRVGSASTGGGGDNQHTHTYIHVHVCTYMLELHVGEKFMLLYMYTEIPAYMTTYSMYNMYT